MPANWPCIGRSWWTSRYANGGLFTKFDIVKILYVVTFYLGLFTRPDTIMEGVVALLGALEGRRNLYACQLALYRPIVVDISVRKRGAFY
jgi:hypothetical protein